MEMKILIQEKDSLEIELENLTLAELLRVYLNRDSNVDFAAWKRTHPTKNPVLAVKGKNPKKSIKDAVSTITKDLTSIEKDFDKMK